MKMLGYVASIATILTLFLGVWVYMNPNEPITGANQEIVSTVTGDNNVTVVGNNNHIQSLPPEEMPEVVVEVGEKLELMTTGLSRRKVEALFGIPSFDSKIQGKSARNATFVFPEFFLQVLFSADDSVVFYSVTSRSVNFNPKVPYREGRLLETKFADLGEAEHLYSALSSKHYQYAEKIYLGNPGSYRNLYLGYCPSGIYPDSSKFSAVVLEVDGAEAWHQFRQTVKPNCFGVGDILGVEEELVQQIGLGPDYFTTRELGPRG